MNVILPDNCKGVTLENFKGSCDLSKMNNFDLYTLSTTESKLTEMLKTVSKGNEINELIFRVNSIGLQDFSMFQKVYEETGNHLRIRKISNSSDGGSGVNLVGLKGIECIIGLEELYLQNCKNLKDISALQSQSDTLKNVSLPGGSISKCGVFKDLNKLTYVNLQNNSISDYYTDEETGETIYNIKVICDAVKRGCENETKVSGKNVEGTLQLKGNNGVTDWSYYLSENWKKGSNYGRADN